MAKKSGKTASAAEAKPEEKKPEQHYDYTSFILRDRKQKDGNYRSPLSPKIKEDGGKDWVLNVHVPESVSPTGYMNVTMPSGKLSSDPEGKKNLFFKTSYKDKEGNPVEHANTYYIANEVGTLKGVATGSKDQAGVGTEISISPADLRKAVIEQSKADSAKYAKNNQREVPDVAQTEADGKDLQAGE